MNPLLSHPRIANGNSPFLLLDGGVSTMLCDVLGATPSQRLWTAALPLGDESEQQLVMEGHRRWIEAGVDILTSCTYQASVDGFAECLGLERERAELAIQKGIAMAKEARSKWSNGRKILVAASHAPIGAHLTGGEEYRGGYPEEWCERMEAFHSTHLRLLIDGAPDIVAVETVPRLDEALVVAKVMARDFRSTPYWISFSCCDGKHIGDGTLFSECVAALSTGTKFPNLCGIGVNCTPPRFVSELLRSAVDVLDAAQRRADLCLLAYPNSGEMWVNGEWEGSPTDVDAEMVTLAREWAECTVRVVGGCCRVLPGTISELDRLRLT